jgi:hypothetical protein
MKVVDLTSKVNPLQDYFLYKYDIVISQETFPTELFVLSNYY